MGSMGKRRGRRTRSDGRGGRVNIDRGVSTDWPGVTGPSIFTFEGSMLQRWAVSGNLARAQGRGAVPAGFLWLLEFPPIAIASLFVDGARWLRRRGNRDNNGR